MKLQADKIRKEFLRENRAKGTNRFTAVAETDLTLESGTVTVLTGRSGSGKTTLLQMLCGLSQPTGGRILLDGDDLYAMPDGALSALRGKAFGVIPQGQTALHSLTVHENILLPFTLRGAAPDLAYIDTLLERLDIASLRDASPSELSGGELRRMAIARAAAGKPAFLFADEPTGDLDDENTEEVFRFLREQAESGAAVLIVTHERDAAHYADRVLQMHAGVLSELT